MLELSTEVRMQCAADESLLTPIDAQNLSTKPHSFGIYNIKLMKCGGVHTALQIAKIANNSEIKLMWGMYG